MGKRYKLGGPNFAQEILDGEAIIVNLEKGSYYSLDQAGALIWHLLSMGASEGEVLAELIGSYSGQRSEIEAGFKDLVENLEREGILVVDQEAVYRGKPSTTMAAEGKPAFVKPSLQKYTDMEAILMLDPIHDVDADGWPNAKPGA